MQKAHSNINWENYPSDATPINEQNLNKMDNSVDEIDNRVISLDTTKFDKTEAARLVKGITFDRATGIFTITYYSGATATIDTLLEKLAVNFDYDVKTQRLIITLDDGEVKYIDMSSLITQYEFLESDTIAFSVDGSGKVSAIVKDGSITEDKLRPDYLADIKVEAAKAKASQQAAAQSEANAAASENAAADAASAALESEKASKASEINAKSSEINAADSEAAAADAASASKASERNAKTSEANAKTSETNAGASQNAAAGSAAAAAKSAMTAINKADEASDYAMEAESFVHGGTGIRPNEDIDNGEYYYNQTKSISESFAGVFFPMGTVSFAQLPDLARVNIGDMYNISDDFTTNSLFKEGAGYTFPAGTNIYKTADGFWDCLAGAAVVGVKGSEESNYRKGYVNLSPANIGALAANGDSKNNTVTFTEAAARANINSKESHATIFGKIKKVISDLKAVAFSGNYNDLSNKPTIPTSLPANGGNADTVDGKHASDLQNYNNLSNRPSIPAAVAVKGNAETAYRTGNVNITPANIGLGNVNNTADSAKSVKYASSAGSVAWGNVTGKPSTFTPASHNHDGTYLKLSGGTVTGYTTFNSPIRCNSVIYFDQDLGPCISSTNQKMTFQASNEYNYKLHFGVFDGTWTLCPGTDGYLQLGSPNHKWGSVYAHNGTIQTSDKNQKKDIYSLDGKYLQLFSLLKPVSYHMIDGTSGRTHIGFIAQDVEEAMEQVGLSALDFAGFCKDVKMYMDDETYTEEERYIDEETEEVKTRTVEKTRIIEKPIFDDKGNQEYVYGLRYEEFIALITDVLQRTMHDVSEIKKEIKELKKQINIDKS